MKKKLSFKIGLVMVVALGVSSIWAIRQIEIQKKSFSDCPFCNPSILARQTVFRGNGGSVLLTHKPAIKGHALIIPERHVVRFEDLTGAELSEIRSLIAKVDQAERRILGSTGYILLQKNGQEAGQSVPHVHFHYLPRKQGDSGLWLAVRIFIAPWLKPLPEAEMKERILEFEELSPEGGRGSPLR